MNDLKHSPAPWKVLHRDMPATIGNPADRLTVVVASDYEIVVRVFRPIPGTREEGEANAHLIAAAPDLLQELREARAVAIALLGAMPPALQRKWPGIVARAKRLGLEENDSPAIAKAEGRS